MADLADTVESLKRAVAVPGAFSDSFPNTSDDDLAATMADALAECQLYGFLTTYSLDDTIVTPDLPLPSLALVVLFASTRILESELQNRKTHIRYEAGSAVFEQDQGSQLLSQRLKDLSARKADLLERADRANYETATFTADLYAMKALSGFTGTLSDDVVFGVA